jgi:glutamate synthase domain-containing protein 2
MTNRLSVSVSKDVYEYAQTKNNVSAYIQDLIEADMRGVNTKTIGLELQERTLEQEAQAALEKHERIENQLEEIREIRQNMQDEKTRALEQARENLNGVPREPTNIAIEHWAKKVGVTPEELCQRL